MKNDLIKNNVLEDTEEIYNYKNYVTRETRDVNKIKEIMEYLIERNNFMIEFKYIKTIKKSKYLRSVYNTLVYIKEAVKN